MKHYYLILMLLLAAAGFTSCHTTEQNYRAAYDKAVQKQRNGMDSLTLATIAKEKNAPTAIVGNDSVKLVTEYANPVDCKFSDVKRYSVVVGTFKQIFNARSMRDRINAAGGNVGSYVVLSKGRDYLVIAKGFDNSLEAATYLKHVKKNVKVGIPLEYPYILKKP